MISKTASAFSTRSDAPELPYLSVRVPVPSMTTAIMPAAFSRVPNGLPERCADRPHVRSRDARGCERCDATPDCALYKFTTVQHVGNYVSLGHNVPPKLSILAISIR